MYRQALSTTAAIATLVISAGQAFAAADSTEAEQSTAVRSGTLDEIVVTAQKTRQNVQKAPAAISVVSGEMLVQQGITDIRGISALIPSARFGVQNDSTQIFIRGIGSSNDAPWVPESVATNLDGAFLPRLVTGTALYDTARIEVLPGPQGTLYGRSAIGGVVNVYANRPTAKYETDGMLEVGDFGLVHATLVQNAPVSENLSVRGALNFGRHTGYNDNDTYAERSYAGRFSALYTPAADLQIFAWASYYENHLKISPTQYSPYPAGGAWSFPQFDASTAAFYPPAGVDLRLGRGEFKATTAGAELEWLLGDLTLTYIPSFVRYRGDDQRAIAGFKQTLQSEIDQYSQELRLTNSGTGRWNNLLGLYWLQNDTDHRYVFGPNFGGGVNPYRATTYAGYGQFTFAVTDTFRLTAGGRYSLDETKASNAEAYFPIFNPVTFGFDRGVVPYSFKKDWTRVDWKAGFEFDATARSLVYGNVQTGYNPGTYEANPIALNPSREIRPQKSTAYTVGAKNRFFDNRVQANIEAFYYDYTDLIVQQYDGATGTTFVYNAPQAEMYGVQLDSSFALSGQDRLYANLGYLHAKFDELTVRGVDYAGFDLPTAPHFTASVGVQHTWNHASQGSTVLRIDSYYNSGYWALFDHPADLHQASFTKTDLALTYYSANGRWDLGAWVKNIEDEPVIASSAVTGKPFPLAAAVYVEPPRTYGLRLHVNFGG